jgi:predicted amidophosphoribosyltransferase
MKTQSSDSTTSMTTAPTRRCEFCGYDLRGITSERCPECGQAKTIALRFDDALHFHKARSALEHEGLLVSFVTAGLASEIVYGTARSAGWLRVSMLDGDRVADLLHRIGVRWVEEARVFVDRNEPACPRCGEDLSAAANDCPRCRVGVQWIDESASIIGAEDEVVCGRCLREVQLVHGCCPDCGESIASPDS